MPKTEARDRIYLLTKLGLALLDGGDEHVTDTARGQTVQAGLDAVHGNNVQVLGTRVVRAVHDRGHGQAHGHAELGALATSSPYNMSGLGRQSKSHQIFCVMAPVEVCKATIAISTSNALSSAITFRPSPNLPWLIPRHLDFADVHREQRFAHIKD